VWKLRRIGKKTVKGKCLLLLGKEGIKYVFFFGGEGFQKKKIGIEFVIKNG